MGFLFNAAEVASGLTGIASNIAYGASLAGSAYSTIENTSAALARVLGYSGRSYSSVTNYTGGSPTQWLNQYISNAYSENGILRYVYSKLFQEYTPDISGYTLLFISPPVLSGYLNLGNQNYDPSSTSFFSETSKLCPLLAVNFTPPAIQLNTGALAGSSGTQHYATELNITDSMSVSFVDTINLDIYTYHATWLQYIYQILEGTLSPSAEYLLTRKIDYCSSFYFVKFKPNMNAIQYIGKAIKYSVALKKI